jgi:hypothetical protein
LEAASISFRYADQPAGMVTDAAIGFDRDDVAAHPFQEVPIVTRRHHRSWPVIEEGFERAQGVEVEVVGGLVEQQHVGDGGQHPQQLESAPFPTGQIAHRGRVLG